MRPTRFKAARLILKGTKRSGKGIKLAPSFALYMENYVRETRLIDTVPSVKLEIPRILLRVSEEREKVAIKKFFFLREEKKYPWIGFLRISKGKI